MIDRLIPCQEEAWSSVSSVEVGEDELDLAWFYIEFLIKQEKRLSITQVPPLPKQLQELAEWSEAKRGSKSSVSSVCPSERDFASAKKYVSEVLKTVQKQIDDESPKRRESNFSINTVSSTLSDSEINVCRRYIAGLVSTHWMSILPANFFKFLSG